MIQLWVIWGLGIWVVFSSYFWLAVDQAEISGALQGPRLPLSFTGWTQRGALKDTASERNTRL